MRRFRLIAPLAVAALIGVAAGACKKSEQASPGASGVTPNPANVGEAVAVPTAGGNLRVTDVSLGKAVTADKKIQTPSETFAPTDTIFVSVATDGTATSKLRAKWTFQDGQVVKEDTKTISPTGPANTEFSIQKASGWPKGSYKVEISVNDQPATSKSFRVQ